MFAVNSEICAVLRAKKKWRKETCFFCCVPVSKCRKLIKPILVEAVPEGFVDKVKFPEREGYRPDNR
jgi:hypothetical protein